MDSTRNGGWGPRPPSIEAGAGGLSTGATPATIYAGDYRGPDSHQPRAASSSIIGMFPKNTTIVEVTGKTRGLARYRINPPVAAMPQRRADTGGLARDGRGKVESHANILQRDFHPLQAAAGIVDQNGKPKYGLHALRPAAAALFIDHGTSPKRLQAIMGHESIPMTFDLYGYLFDLRDDDRGGMQTFGARVLEAS